MRKIAIIGTAGRFQQRYIHADRKRSELIKSMEKSA